MMEHVFTIMQHQLNYSWDRKSFSLVTCNGDQITCWSCAR